MTITSDWDPEKLRKCQQEDPDLKSVIHGLEMNKRSTREEIAAESPVAKAYWAQWNSLKLVSGCLHRVWESEIWQSSRALMIIPKVRIPAINVAGPFPISELENKYVLVVMNYFSKWPEAYAIPTQEAGTVPDVFINNWVSRYGVPIELHSDQLRNFESALIQEICQKLGIRKTRTTARHTQSDGMVERFNRTLKEYLRKVVDKYQKDWVPIYPCF